MKKKKEPTVASVLRYMKKLLAKGWTRGAFARDSRGREVGSLSPNAVRYCLLGAAGKAASELDALDQSYVARYLILACSKARSIPKYNDAPKRKKSEILAVVDCAIKKAISEQKG